MGLVLVLKGKGVSESEQVYTEKFGMGRAF